MQSLRWKWIFFAGWLLLVFLSLWFNFTSIDKTAFEMAVTQGRTSWTKDQSYKSLSKKNPNLRTLFALDQYENK
jgi:hypothetical protein